MTSGSVIRLSHLGQELSDFCPHPSGANFPLIRGCQRNSALTRLAAASKPGRLALVLPAGFVRCDRAARLAAPNPTVNLTRYGSQRKPGRATFRSCCPSGLAPAAFAVKLPAR